MQRLAVLALSAFSIASFANCPQHALTDPAKVRLTGDSLMIVTHASSNDDGRIASKFGVDEAVRFAKKSHIPVVYLQDDRPAENYFMRDCDPDYWVSSKDGEIRFEIAATHVYLVGGHLELCLAATANDILMQWSKMPRSHLTLTYFMDGVYSNGMYMEESDPYHRDYLRFMGIVNYGRPASEYFPKLTLLETMGIIVNETRQIDYLRRALPHYERTLPSHYRVELRLSEASSKVLQPGKRQPGQTTPSPALLIEFLDSADPLSFEVHY